MLLKTLTTISLVAICVDGMAPDYEHKPKHAVSSQSFHRDDVPLSYKYSSVHVYTTPHPEQRSNHHTTQNHHTIQYAPLQQTKEHQNKIAEQRNEDATERTLKNYLEPRLVTENSDQHSHSYRSYVPGHNIEVLQSGRVQGHNDLYRAYHDQHNLRNQKAPVNTPNFIIYRKPVQEEQITSQNKPHPENHNVLYTFLPKQFGANSQYNNYAMEKPKSMHQAFNAKLPRLHLNLARVYNIANVHQQAPINLPRVSSFRKPPTYTEAIFLPLKNQHKTILYPVQDTSKNYPTLP